MTKKDAIPAGCPCGSAQIHQACCGPYLSGERRAQTAEQLMRARYCSFVYRNERYLLSTWHPTTRPNSVQFDERQRWLGLSIRETQAGNPNDQEGHVEFVARFKMNGKGHRLHEKSRFAKVGNNWYYVSGEFL